MMLRPRRSATWSTRDLLRACRSGTVAGILLTLQVGPAVGADASEGEPVPTSARRPDAPWAQLEVGATPLDGQRRALRGRFYFGASLGYRWQDFGLFATLSHDTFVELIEDADPLRLMHAGLGLEWLWLWGRVRSSISAGASTVLSRDGLARRGSTGWFIDVRPSAFRFPIGESCALEWVPLMFDLTVPDVRGIPLVLPSYMTVLALEWSGV